MEKTRIIFFGFSEVGYESLKFLIDKGCEVVAVFTHDTDAHEECWFETAESLAKKYNIPVYKPESLKSQEWTDIVTSLKPDLILSLYYRNFIPPAIFTQANKGAYNMHGSYLPRYRGRAPLNWSIINGEDHCGASLHVLEEGFDTGDIVAQEKVEIGKDEYVIDVIPRVSEAALKVLKYSIDSLIAGNPKLTPQDHSKATYFGRRTPKDGEISFSKTAREVFNLVRGVSHPFPGAFFFDEKGRKITVWRAEIGEDTNGESCGAIVSANPLKIACADKYIIVTEFTCE